MNAKLSGQFIWTIGIMLALIACNGGNKPKVQSETADTTSTTKTQTEVAQPPAQPATIDAVTAAPNLYKVVADSLGIRILETTYKPGDSSAMHSHPDNAIYVIQGGKATFTGKDGKATEIELKTGMSAVRPAEDHSVKNTGKSTMKVLLVEVNRPMDNISRDATMDATKVAPNLYKVKSDSMGIRVLEIDYKPGQSSAMHAHPDGALYIINGGKSEFTNKDGSKQTLTLKSGEAMIAAAGVHSVKNVGTTTTKAILVEVYRQRK
jgi:quercetin dioxygenase-like cupin family protein